VFAIGSICDIIGIKKSFYLGISLLCISRLGIGWGSTLVQGDAATLWNDLGLGKLMETIGVSYTPTFSMKQLVIMVSILIMSLGTAFISPVTQTALRRFTTKDNRATGFNLYYLFMNISAIIATAFVIDGARKWLGPTVGNYWIMNFAFFMTIGSLLCTAFINENNYEDEDERITEGANQRRPLAIFMEVWKERPFQKLVAFLLLTMGVRLVFTLQFLVMPKYYTRVLYEDFELGFANSINPIIIVLGLIIIIPVINKYSTMKLMMWGMLISALSLCFMVLPIEWFLALPWIHTMSEAFVFVIFTQIIMFAFGELLFSPRFTEYVASVAPKDKVASYMALSALPMFIAKPINGFLSGLLVSIFCYEGIRAKIDTGNIDYGDSPQFMWAIYFVFALLSPLFIMAFKKWLTVNTGTTPTEADDEEAVSAAAKIESPEEQQAESIVNLIPENNSNN
jgi:MFS family permease